VYDTPRHPYTLRLLAATPRIARTDGEGYKLARHAGAESPAPPGFAYYAGEASR
jgi:ABC-type dipeptide/oligopeptide/nickel transport system ATPase component